MTGVILQGPSEETLWEKEATNPEDGWNAVIDPTLHEADPLKQV